MLLAARGILSELKLLPIMKLCPKLLENDWSIRVFPWPPPPKAAATLPVPARGFWVISESLGYGLSPPISVNAPVSSKCYFSIWLSASIADSLISNTVIFLRTNSLNSLRSVYWTLSLCLRSARSRTWARFCFFNS